MESGSYHVLVCYLPIMSQVVHVCFFLLTGAILMQYSFMVDINYCVNLQVNLPLYIMAVQL